jgi:hypothetical protein
MDFTTENITIEYEGQTFTGESLHDIIIALKKSDLNLVYRDIAEIVGTSHETVRLVLTENGLNYPPEYPQLENKELFESYEDQIISVAFNIPLTTVAKARKRHGIKKQFYVNFTQRRQKLVEGVFGKGYFPGLNFINYIEEKLSGYTDRQKRIIGSFYMDGTEITIDNTDKVERTNIKRGLKKDLANENIQELIEKGVLWQM